MSPEDEALERFEAWLAEQPAAYRDLFVYVAPAVGAPYRTTSAKRRAVVAQVVRTIARDAGTVAEFAEVRRRYDASPWRNRETGQKIPLNPSNLLDVWSEHIGAVRAGTGVDESPPAGNGHRAPPDDFNLTPAQRQAREIRARVKAERERLEREANGTDETGPDEVARGVERNLGGPDGRLCALEAEPPRLRAVR